LQLESYYNVLNPYVRTIQFMLLYVEVA